MGTFIAEIKPLSPWDGASRFSEETLRFTAIMHGDWVAAHTEAPWGGSLDHLRSVKADLRRRHADKPLLAKGIHADDDLLIEALGIADFALVVGRIPEIPDEYLERVIFEPTRMGQALNFHSERGPGIKIMWNLRDLRTGQLRSDSLRADGIRGAFGDEIWLCQASFIESAADVLPEADAHIVGTHLMDYVYGGES